MTVGPNLKIAGKFQFLRLETAVLVEFLLFGLWFLRFGLP